MLAGYRAISEARNTTGNGGITDISLCHGLPTELMRCFITQANLLAFAIVCGMYVGDSANSSVLAMW